MKIIVVIPAYNAEKSIIGVVFDVFQYVKDIVIVNDGSRDNTLSQAKKTPAVVLNHFINRGQGAALQTGNDYALSQGADIIINFDADGQHQAKDIKNFIQPIIEGKVDVVLGSRFLKESDQSKIPFSKRYFLLPIARLINRFFTGLVLTDAHNGFRALSRKAALMIKIKQDRMAHNTEIPRLIKENNLSFCERPTNMIYNEYGQGFGGGIKIMVDLVKDKFIN